MKTQGGLMAEDRQALLAEQQASMERLVSLISASINRDLPLRMEEIVRAEVTFCGVSARFPQSLVVHSHHCISLEWHCSENLFIDLPLICFHIAADGHHLCRVRPPS